ncbi:DUF6046 domain-containing protein [Myroides sp. mNGS23_01]|nr:DUF6046 domain-containing protein [Myroides sp. mNGS23_01]WHT39970.1 DUF6046 domain-containing protein [Myroides sp. mNGS23_01]
MNDIVMSSLLGSKIIKQIPYFQKVELFTGQSILPLNSPLVQQNDTEEETTLAEPLNENKKTIESQQFFPLTLSVDGSEEFTLPYEPVISIEGKNNIIKRSVLKYNEQFSGSTFGTVKERWSMDDYKITITGALFGTSEIGAYESTYPREDFERLKNFLLQGKEIKVKSIPFELLGISYIAIEDFSFPFTKGENVQAYVIKAISDVPMQLFME